MSDETEYTIEKLRRRDIKDIARLLGIAFADMPLAEGFEGNPRYVGAVYGGLARAAMKDKKTAAHGVRRDGALVGLALLVRGDWDVGFLGVLPTMLRVMMSVPWRIFKQAVEWMREIGRASRRIGKLADEMELLLLAVEPGMHGRGIGRALLGKCYEVARERGFRTLRLETIKGVNAVEIYEKQGFIHEGEFPVFGETLMVMRKSLAEE